MESTWTGVRGSGLGTSSAWQDTSVANEPPQFSLKPGFVIGNYKILDQIGRGGCGQVYRAEQNPIGRIVAIKIAEQDPTKPKEYQRWLREAQAMACVNHPNVITIYDAGVLDGIMFIAMELLPGGDVRSEIRVAGGQISEIRSLAIIRDAAVGLAELHRQGIIHRDVKPGNLLLDANGRVKVSDMGLIKDQSPSALDQPDLTTTGFAVGTPAFMAPEQLNGNAIGTATDVYSLGATLHTLITGKPPSIPAIAGKSGILGGIAFPPPLTMGFNISPRTNDLILRLCNVDPQWRIDSMTEVVDHINEILSPQPFDISQSVKTHQSDIHSDGFSVRKEIRNSWIEFGQQWPGYILLTISCLTCFGIMAICMSQFESLFPLITILAFTGVIFHMERFVSKSDRKEHGTWIKILTANLGHFLLGSVIIMVLFSMSAQTIILLPLSMPILILFLAHLLANPDIGIAIRRTGKSLKCHLLKLFVYGWIILALGTIGILAMGIGLLFSLPLILAGIISLANRFEANPE